MAFTKITDLTDAGVTRLLNSVDHFGVPKAAWISDNGKYTILLLMKWHSSGTVRNNMVSIAGNTRDSLTTRYSTFYCEADGSTAFIVEELMELVDQFGRNSLKLKEHVAVFRNQLLHDSGHVNGPDVVSTGSPGYSATSIINLLGVSRHKAEIKSWGEHGIH